MESQHCLACACSSAKQQSSWLGPISLLQALREYVFEDMVLLLCEAVQSVLGTHELFVAVLRWKVGLAVTAKPTRIYVNVLYLICHYIIFIIIIVYYVLGMM